MGLAWQPLLLWGVEVMSDAFDLQRFVDAQASVYDSVVEELRQGKKRSHWMWYIFPQIHGLGFSATAKKYAIASAQEAQAYLAHPVLGPRLQDCTQLVLQIEGRRIEQIFPYPDDLKFRSCMTLFDDCAAADESLFRQALVKYFNGQPDLRTLELLAPM